jgi:hypothetical protein
VVTARELVEHVEHFAERLLQEAIDDARAATYLRLAETLEWARPREGDFHGKATHEELRARYDRLTEQAEACRNRAAVALLGGEEW